MQDINSIIQNNKVVLIDCWAQWCPQCVAMLPAVDALSVELGDKANILKVNVGEQEDFAAQFNITSLPTFLIFKEGNLVEKFNGSTSAIELKQKLNALM